MGLGWGEFVDFHFKSLVGEDAILATFDRSSQTMKATPRLLALEDKIVELGAVCVAIDTSADVFGGDEINRTQVRQFIGLLRGICRRSTLLDPAAVASVCCGDGKWERHQWIDGLE